MAITATGQNAATTAAYQDPVKTKDKSILAKDDFLQLLLVQLQHQDPTEPMNSEKILTQTSQLAALESSNNTNKALADLADSLSNTQQFSVISSIGKRADLGSDAIKHDQSTTSSFEVYFPENIAKDSGTVNITDLQDNVIATIPIEMPKDANGNLANKLDAGVYQFDWDGKDKSGNPADSGIYRVSAEYKNTAGVKNTTRLGAYPIESVKFENGKALVKLGSSYIPLENIVEVY